MKHGDTFGIFIMPSP